MKDGIPATDYGPIHLLLLQWSGDRDHGVRGTDADPKLPERRLSVHHRLHTRDLLHAVIFVSGQSLDSCFSIGKGMSNQGRYEDDGSDQHDLQLELVDYHRPANDLD